MASFSTILISNRGEIAVRIARTARKLGLRTVAVYSDADVSSPHVRVADLAVNIGGAPASESYLNTKTIIEAARTTGSEAIHPGYGFLSESADFAEACLKADLIFVGPEPEAIRLMGDKATAKRIMAEKGVPCLPGYDGAAQDEATFASEADRIGYPVMLKATGGGGGKGMRLVYSEQELREGLPSAQAEAMKAFGNPQLMLEKAIVAPRHVEVQIFADTLGNVVHLGDRDCSIQRRHQKIIEEAPAPNLDPTLRQEIAQAALIAAQAISYRGAGTVEFLVTADRRFYFLEMNTRLQVEHPVTEMVTGLDLVEWQLRVAAGEALPLPQKQIVLNGHAIEARVCAEDSTAGFLPQTGRLTSWIPATRSGIRIDHALEKGVHVTGFYDSMIAKIIGYGEDREQARQITLAAVKDTFIAGVETNQAFLIECMQSRSFADAEFATDFIERLLAESKRDQPPDPLFVILAATIFYRHCSSRYAGPLFGWRNSAWTAELVELQSGDWFGGISVTPLSGTQFSVLYREIRKTVSICGDGAQLNVTIDGVQSVVAQAWDGNSLTIQWCGKRRSFTESEPILARNTEANTAFVASAPMPGLVTQVNVSAGDVIEKGAILLILEAMKMEHMVRAPVSGRVASIKVKKGQQVASRESLVEIDPETG
ncbi:acetyl/propionyl/methylcrotonyl-CoA carboxylase subunit alpha [Pseudorhodoplanes sp.]|uniref:acetyl/propionyl/methylcrotonyl-CoA carboxylase subunit alpha n=1 Tax=Pseudorhodoplanes sp. TaxID=1934341 RepID=UPI003D0FF469